MAHHAAQAHLGTGGGINSPERLIGMGTFRVKDTQLDSFVLSEANPDYFRNAPDGDPSPYLEVFTRFSSLTGTLKPQPLLLTASTSPPRCTLQRAGA